MCNALSGSTITSFARPAALSQRPRSTAGMGVSWLTEDNMIFIGIHGSVLALDPATGEQLWQTKLKGGQFVNVTVVDNTVYATTKGEIFALDPVSGEIRWHNPLTGLGLGLVSIAGSAQAALAAEQHRRDQAAGAAAVAASAGGAA